MTNANIVLLDAFNKGYRVIDNEVYYKGRVVKKQNNKGSGGYCSFYIRSNQKSKKVKVHRLVAFQKYGIKIFEKGLEVRHKNNDKSDNYESNILLGTHQDNMLDIPEGIRMKYAINASKCAMKHNHLDILKLYQNGASYNDIMRVYGIKSKGTISFIIKKSIQSKSKI